MQRLAIFGGTFDPPHVGHLSIARAAQTQWALDRVLWVPVYAPRHRVGAVAEYGDRLELVSRALQDATDSPAVSPQVAYPPLPFQLSTIERQLSQPCYAIDTFRALESQNPNSQWFWIIGLDAFERLPHWYGRAELIPRCFWLVAPRSPTTEAIALASIPTQPTPDAKTGMSDDLHRFDAAHPVAHWIAHRVAQQLADQGIALRWQLLDLPLLPVSSSLIRDRLRRNASVQHLVSESVRQYIEARSLYGEREGGDRQNPKN